MKCERGPGRKQSNLGLECGDPSPGHGEKLQEKPPQSRRTAYIDAHCHIFNERIVKNVSAKPDMLQLLKLNTHDSRERLPPKALQTSAEQNCLDACILLPTAGPDKVQSENDRFVGFTREFSRLRTLATLHPSMPGPCDEIRRMFDADINGFKFSSFSQRFDLLSPESTFMLSEVERLGRDRAVPPILVFDTFATAHHHFGANPEHLTTPAKLATLAHRYQGINFVGAHMGGLLADFDDLCRFLLPAPNLYLDTANAAHTFHEDQFVELLRTHCANHILFGTDWPWFLHAAERTKITDLLEKAGYDQADQAAVFGGNAQRLFGV